MSTDDAATETVERATIRLVSEQIKGLERLTDAGFKDVQRQLDRVENMPVVVAALQSQNYDQEKRIRELESADTRGAEWRRTHLPALIFAALSLAATIALVVSQIH